MDGNFRLEGKDEYPHQPDASPNFNESVYTNAFDSKTRMGGWARIGLNITPSGKVLPCHAAETIAHLAFDNVRDRPLEEISH